MKDSITITNITSVNPKWRRAKRIRLTDGKSLKSVRPNSSINVSIEWGKDHIAEIVTKIEPHKMKHYHKFIVSEEDYSLIMGVPDTPRETPKKTPPKPVKPPEPKKEEAPPKQPPKTATQEDEVVTILDDNKETPKGPGAATIEEKPKKTPKKETPQDKIFAIVGGKEGAEEYLDAAKADELRELAEIAGLEYKNKPTARIDLLEYLGLMDE